MLIGLLSDTHDHVPHAEQAADLFRKRETGLVLHAGDFCSPFMIPPFEGLNLKGVFGNNDGDLQTLLAKARAIGAELAGDFLSVEADGLKIAVYHGTHGGITSALHHAGQYDVVVSGHTHEVVNRRIGRTLALNPGTAHGFDGKATAGLLDTETGEVEIVELD